LLIRFSNFLEKKCGVIIAAKVYEKFGTYVYVRARKEDSWKALLRLAELTQLEGKF